MHNHKSSYRVQRSIALFFGIRKLPASLKIVIIISITAIFNPLNNTLNAQQYPASPDTTQRIQLKLGTVIERLKNENLSIQASRQRIYASSALLQAAKDNTLPHLNIKASYQRFSRLTLYEDGLTDAHSVDRYPDQNSVSMGAEASFNIYSGGKQKLNIRFSELHRDLDILGTQQLTGDITLQAIFHYLDMIRLTQLDTVLLEEVNRAGVRLKNIRALYKNQIVTKSDLLRAEVGLSSSKLSLKQAQNDLKIANQQLNILIGLPDSTIIIPVEEDFPAIISDGVPITTADDLFSGTNNAYGIRRYNKNMELQAARIHFSKADYLPSLQLYSAYGLQYPNQLFTPPVARWYSVGFIGIRAGYDISALFHNKSKVKAEEIKLMSIALDKANFKQQLSEKLKALNIKYQESSERIQVAIHSIQQANVNLKIVSLKYFNQLALLTDLLEADKLLVTSTYDLVKAKMDRKLLFYKIGYTLGKL